jgi:anti-sigma factor RsiW
MSCRNYETILTEVARGQMLDAGAKTDALAHAETCPRCAVRLADQKALSAGLRSLSASAAAAQTPARVEAALSEAFRQRSTSVPVIAPARASSGRRKR